MTEIEFRAGRRSSAYTNVPDWVALSGIPIEAAHLYQLLRMHVVAGLPGPTFDTLTALTGWPIADIGAWLTKLVRLEAIALANDAWAAEMPQFVIHEDPPAGYVGPVTLADWYRLNAPEGGES